MDRVTGNTTDIGSGRRGFRGRNIGLGQAGTIPGAVWFNGIQEEIARAIEICGITLSDANREQLIQAMRRLAGGTVSNLTATTALTADQAGLIRVSAAVASRTLTLPAANSAGGLPLRMIIERTDAVPANSVTIARAGADTINGLTTSVTMPAGSVLSLMSDGVSAWTIVGVQGFVDVRALGTAGTTNQVVPIWARRAFVRGIGGGGGGGGANAGGVATGGAGGGYGEDEYLVTPGETISCVVGAGGTAGAGGAGLTNGGTGGSTSFGSRMSCTGGGPGVAASGAIQTAGVAGGTSNARYSRAGASPQAGNMVSSVYFASVGGASALAPYGALVMGAGTAGNNAIGPGQGGNGGTNTSGGGGGGAGLLLIEFRP
jgi:hypothetical protein